jgi:hypothetical protein
MAENLPDTAPELQISARRAPTMTDRSSDVASHYGNATSPTAKVSRSSLLETGAETPKAGNDVPEESASSSTCGGDAENPRPGNRKSRKREKQRARRALQRQQKREVVAVEPVSQSDKMREDTEEETKRHRPTPVERSMNFFMTMADWSRFFLRSEHWLPRLNAGGKLDIETAESISRVVKQCWVGGDGGSGFKSLEEVERFTELKEKEALYIEKQLKRMPSLQDEVWKTYYGELEKLAKQRPVEEILTGPAEFLRDTILPCLQAQVMALRARTREVRVLRDKYEGLCRKLDRQEELRSVISSLRISQGLMIPACPVWREVQAEIESLQGNFMEPHDWSILDKNRWKAQLAYEEGLGRILRLA